VVLFSLCCSNASKIDFGFLYIFRVIAVSFFKAVGRDSSGGIGTRYGPDCPGIESQRGDEIICIRAYWPWCPPILLYNAYRVIFPRVNQPVLAIIIHPIQSRG
jgi:hypothetical protein